MKDDSNSSRSVTYAGPTRFSTFSFCGKAVRLLRPVDPDRLLDDPEALAWNRHDDYMPYWAYLWPGAYFLAEAVAREPERPGVVALEIGCGLGLGGLVGLGRGRPVTVTGYD